LKKIEYEGKNETSAANYLEQENFEMLQHNEEFENTNVNININMNPSHKLQSKFYDFYQYDFENTINNLTEKKICPFYYFMHLLSNSINPPDVVICTVSDFLDLKKRIQITELLKTNIQNYKLILDESSDILNQISFNYSMNIDESLLLNASNQLFILKENYLQKENLLKEYEENYKNLMENFPCDREGENSNLTKINTKSENEFLLFNGMANFQSSNIGLDNKIPGIMRKPIHFINLISRLITFFRNFIFNPIKSENVWNIYTFQQQLLKELWVEFKNLKFLFGRLILLLTELRWENYEK
jgi:hypothetical protein